VRAQQRVAGGVALQRAVGGQVAAVEGEEEAAQPVVRPAGEGVEDRVQEELAEVVDAVRDEGGDGQVVGAGGALGGGEVVEGDAGEVEQRVFVVGGEVGDGLGGLVGAVKGVL
jgi:hypothetical protein